MSNHEREYMEPEPGEVPKMILEDCWGPPGYVVPPGYPDLDEFGFVKSEPFDMAINWGVPNGSVSCKAWEWNEFNPNSPVDAQQDIVDGLSSEMCANLSRDFMEAGKNLNWAEQNELAANPWKIGLESWDEMERQLFEKLASDEGVDDFIEQVELLTEDESHFWKGGAADDK